MKTPIDTAAPARRDRALLNGGADFVMLDLWKDHPERRGA